MRLKSLFRIFTLTGTLAVLFGLALPSISSASCSNGMLSGRYAHLILGAYGPTATAFGETGGNNFPFQGIQMLKFDGQGGLTGQESIVASGAELSYNGNKHFVPVAGSYQINYDCTGIGYICANHTTGQVSNIPCNYSTITNPANICPTDSMGNPVTSPSCWADFVQVTIVLAEGGRQFHMLVIPPYDGGMTVRTISSTGTKIDDEDVGSSSR
jgi:hypothetical protein